MPRKVKGFAGDGEGRKLVGLSDFGTGWGWLAEGYTARDANVCLCECSRARRDMVMRRKGINYDTGFTRFGDRLSREAFVPAQVRREMAVIARDLHCTAV